MHTTAIIVAAGLGDRFGDTPKQFQDLAGKPMLAWSFERFAEHREIGNVVVAVPAGLEDTAKAMLVTRGFRAPDKIVTGGRTRQESVRNGLDNVPERTTHVLIHDAARPCITDGLIERIIEALKINTAVVPTVPAVDTLVRENEHRVDALVDRKQVAVVQTPQGFDLQLAREAHSASDGENASDDGSLVLAIGRPLVTVAGERTNLKVTYKEDMALAAAILEENRP